VSAGGWFIPNANDFRSYFSRVIYRYGAFYEKGGLNINGKDINGYGLSLGANFPIKPSINSFSSIDFAVEFGKKGTVQNNLVQQGFINFKIDLILQTVGSLKTYTTKMNILHKIFLKI
jgi:hypothetical protein